MTREEELGIAVGDIVEFEEDGGVPGMVTAILARVEFPNGTTVAPLADLAVVRKAGR